MGYLCAHGQYVSAGAKRTSQTTCGPHRGPLKRRIWPLRSRCSRETSRLACQPARQCVGEAFNVWLGFGLPLFRVCCLCARAPISPRTAFSGPTPPPMFRGRLDIIGARVNDSCAIGWPEVEGIAGACPWWLDVGVLRPEELRVQRLGVHRRAGKTCNAMQHVCCFVRSQPSSQGWSSIAMSEINFQFASRRGRAAPATIMHIGRCRLMLGGVDAALCEGWLRENKVALFSRIACPPQIAQQERSLAKQVSNQSVVERATTSS